MRIWWCQEHGIGDAAEPLPKFCWLSLAQRAPRPCRMVPMRLIPDNEECHNEECVNGYLDETNTIPHAACHGSGKVYPVDLVDRIARAICAEDANIPFENADREWYRTVAVAVLGAIDGETP